MSIFICNVCGHIEFNSQPEKCPVCFASKFTQNDNVFKESEENSPEASAKHVPAVTVNKECGLVPDVGCVDVIVRIGEVVHPMEEKHHITFIDCYVDDKYVERVSLSPAVYAAGCFHLKTEGTKVSIVENCNVHGYWMKEQSL
ncbi:MAG: desulfoferrodoxin family protein [Fibrobacterota bacterium]